MSKIEWTGKTWNPTVGCKEVSPECGLDLPDGTRVAKCYAAVVAARQMSEAHVGLTVTTDRGVEWTGEVRMLEERLSEPLERKKPTVWFVDSMSDLFHPDVSPEFIDRVWAVMEQTPQHVYQVLTKRPRRMKNWCQKHRPDPLPNVWLGTSIGMDKYTWRARELRDTPAAVRFISAEPLLTGLPSLQLDDIDWLIAGGQSGPNSRPAHPDWMRDLRDRCGAVGVAFFFKQWGNWAPGNSAHAGGSHLRGTARTRPLVLLDSDGHEHDTNELTSFRLPDGWAHMTRMAKGDAGRELDGRTWDEMPADVAKPA